MFDPTELAELPPHLFRLLSMSQAEPEGEPPAPTPCRHCGEPVPAMASLGQWRPGFCRACEPGRVALELDAARQALVRMRVERDAGHLGDELEPRRELLPEIVSWLTHGYPGGYWLCLHGPPGRGKTTQLAALLWGYHERQVTIGSQSLTQDWQTRPDVLERYCRDVRVTYASEREIVRSTYPSAPERRSIEWWIDRGVLMVDEVGRDTRLTDHTVQTLAALYDGRYQRGKSTVLVTNYHPRTELATRNEVWAGLLQEAARALRVREANVK